MKKLLCAVLLGALTLAPSYSQSAGGGAPEARKNVVVDSRYSNGFYLCTVNTIGVVTGKVYLTRVLSIAPPQTCSYYNSK